MIRRIFFSLLCAATGLMSSRGQESAPSAKTAAPAAPAAATDTRCYEMRIYYAHPDRLEALHTRFRDHTTKLFAKHGMGQLGYWVPNDNPERQLIYILSYPTHQAREASWKAFMADSDWKKAQKASEESGPIVAKVKSTFLTASDISPAIEAKIAQPARSFELRTYTCTDGNLPALTRRFRDHTISLFSKHGMSHLGYWNYATGEKGAERTLIYLLAHKSPEAAAASFKAFRDDPAWKAAREASEKAAGGSLTVPDGVKSVFLTPTDYSQTK
jgi:hypothetical protein